MANSVSTSEDVANLAGMSNFMANSSRCAFFVFLALRVAGMLSAASPDSPSPALCAKPFELQQVRLLDGPFLQAMELNKRLESTP